MYIKSLIVFVIFSLTYAKVPYGHRLGLAKPNYIVGGRIPNYGEVKFIVVVYSGQMFCGGGIIDEKFILTAAHCIVVDAKTKQLVKPIRIVGGTNVVYGYDKALVIEREVVKVYTPNDFLKNTLDDIALLELESPLQLLKNHYKLQKLNLPQPFPEDPNKYPNYENERVKFAGYGNTRTEKVQVNGKTEIKRLGAGRLQVANALIHDVSTCYKYFIRSSEFCLSVIEDETKQKPQGTCEGDSGSPAVYNNSIIVGVDSRGVDCDNNARPSIFTRVSSYIPFIHQAMSGNSSGLVVYTV